VTGKSSPTAPAERSSRRTSRGVAVLGISLRMRLVGCSPFSVSKRRGLSKYQDWKSKDKRPLTELSSIIYP
jgi:hypothetical protein